VKRDPRITTAAVSLFFVTLVVSTVLLSRLLLDKTEDHIRSIRGELLETVQELTAQDLTWDFISPSVLRSVTFYGVSISDNARADSVSVGLNLRNIIVPGGGGPVSSVDIVRAEIEMRRDAQWNRLDRTVSFATSFGRRAKDITISFRDSTITAVRDDVRFSLDDLGGTIDIRRAGRIEGEIRTSGDFQSVPDASLQGRTDLQVVFQRQSRTDPVQASVDARRIRSSHFSMEDQSFHAVFDDGGLAVQRVKSNTPMDLEVVYDDETGEITTSLQTSRLVPAEIVRLHGPWQRYDPWLHEAVTGNGVFIFHETDGFLEATGRIESRLSNPEVLPAPLGISMLFEADPGGVTVPEAIVSGSGGTVRVTGTYRKGQGGPNATVRASNFRYADLPVMDGTASFSGGAGTGGFSSERLSFDGVSLYGIVASYRETGGQRRTFNVTTALDDRGVHTLTARGTYRNFEDFTGEISAVRITPDQALEIADVAGYSIQFPRQAGSFEITGSARFDRRGDDFSVRVPYIVITDPASDDRMATLRGRYRNGSVLIDEYIILSDGVRSVGSGLVRFGSGGTIDFETDLEVNGVDYSFRGLYSREGTLIVLGPYGIQARLTRTNQGALRLRGSAVDVPVPFGNATVSLIAEGLFLSREDWYVNFQDVNIRGIPMPAGGSASMNLAVSVAHDAVDVALLRFDDSVSSLSGSLRIDYVPGPDGEIRGNGRFVSDGGNEQYRVVGRYADGDIAADIRLDQAPVRRLDNDIRGGTISGFVQLAGNRRSPQVRAFLESDTIRTGSQDLRLSLRLYGDDRTLEITDTEIFAASRTIAIPDLSLNRESGAIRGSGRIRQPDDRGEVNITLRGQTDPVTSLQGLSVRDIPLTLDVATRNDSSETHLYSIVKGQGRTDLYREDGAVTAALLDDGTFTIELTDPLPVETRASGTFRNGELELTAAGITVDLRALSSPLEDAGVDITGGVARGSLRVLGSPGNPDMYGTFRISDLSVGTPVSPDQIGPIDAAIILEERTVRIPVFETTVGDAPISVGGVVLLDRWNLGEYRLDVEIPGPAGAHVVSTFGPVEVDGFARGSATVAGGPRSLQLDGDLTIYNSEMGVIPMSPSEAGDPSLDLVLNLNIETGRSVRFIWPAADFPVIRSNFAVGQEVDIRLDGPNETFSLTGAVEIQSGDIFYFDRNFLIRDGRIVFQENQDRFDPRVTARAELREVTADGPVRIYLVADGQRLSEFSPRFESNPPLGGTEIVAILGGNIFQQDADGGTNLSTALLSTSGIVTQFSVFREFENSVRQRFGLDLFAIRTSVIQNLLLTAITPTDETTEQLAPTLGNYLNNTSIFMGRYIGESVFAQGIIQMRSADMANPEDNDGIQRLGGVLIDSEISLEWQTPFFMLEWSLAPENPEELFIRDNTFTFSWSFTY
jgi:translocation and assembly module TamB